MIKILNKFLEIIADTVDAYSVCFFLKKGDILSIKSYFSLSPNIKKDIEIKTDKSFLGLISKFNKPVSLKGDKTEFKFSEIYKKNEDIKSYFITPVGKIGLLYVDTKRMYSITEKYQKIIISASKFLDEILKYFENIEKLKTYQIIKKIPQDNFLDFLCMHLKFKWGMIIKREGDKFIVIYSNLNKKNVPSEIDTKNSKLGLLLKKNFRKIDKFTEKNENFFYIPFFKSGILVSALVLFNFDEKMENELKLQLNAIYPFLDLLVLNFILKNEFYRDLKLHRGTEFLTVNFFLNQLNKIPQDYSFIVFRIKNFVKLVKKYEPDRIIFSYSKIKNAIEKIFKKELIAVVGTLNTFFFIVENELISKYKNFIEKNFKKTYLKIENNDENVIFEIKHFKRKDYLLKFLFSSE